MSAIVLKTVLTGGLVALTLAFLFSKKVLRYLGRISFRNGFRPFAPNWITAYSIVITLVGFCVYLIGDPIAGVCIATFGSVLDRIDGKMAHVLSQSLSQPDKWHSDDSGNVFASVTTPNGHIVKKISRSAATLHKWWGEFNFPGTTDLGKIFDPFGDKLKALTFLAYFAFWAHVLSPWLVVIMAVPEIFGTLLRRPFRFLDKLIHQSRSTSVGKYKALLQWLCIIFCIPFDLKLVDAEHWAYRLDWLPNLFLGLSILLAVASVLSRLKLTRRHKEINGILSTLDETVRHD